MNEGKKSLSMQGCRVLICCCHWSDDVSIAALSSHADVMLSDISHADQQEA